MSAPVPLVIRMRCQRCSSVTLVVINIVVSIANTRLYFLPLLMMTEHVESVKYQSMESDTHSTSSFLL